MCEHHGSDEGFWLRKTVLRALARNTGGKLRFYLLLGKLTRVPLFGRMVHLVAEEYGHIYHGGRVAGVAECLELLHQARQITLIDCACRKMHGNCDRPLRTCLAVNTAAEVFAGEEIKNPRVITGEAAAEIIRDSHEQGVVHFISYCMNPHEYVVCNCCSCCCVPLRLRRDYGIYNAMQDGRNVAVINEENCNGCGACKKVCLVRAIDSTGAKNAKEHRITSRCIGCGLCAEACRQKAITMEPRLLRKETGEVPAWLRSALYLPLLLIIFPIVWTFIKINGSQGSR